jgi:two-component system sensor histidine kinase KdpD
MTQPSGRAHALTMVVALAAIAAATVALRLLHLTNPTTAALGYLLIVLGAATVSTLWVAIAVSVAADLCLNYFFMPPFGTLAIADPENWVALFVFLAVTLTVSQLSATARAREREAMARRDELARLFDLSRDILLTTDSQEAISQLARLVARRFELAFAAICLPADGAWEVFDAGTRAVPLESADLSAAFAGADQPARVRRAIAGRIRAIGRLSFRRRRVSSCRCVSA